MSLKKLNLMVKFTLNVSLKSVALKKTTKRSKMNFSISHCDGIQ